MHATLGRYDLMRLVAKGGMADIYLGTAGERVVAIKVLNEERASDPEARALFGDEARLLALLDHPNLAKVEEVDVDRGTCFLAMEYVHGRDLREIMLAAGKANREIPYDAAVAIVASAAAGLDHAHRRCGPDGRPLHLVHRDVSLSNIMVGHAGEVKVVDFGIASATVSSHVTNPGVVRGKASYMSPEQCLGDPVDLRTDVFALGVVLYELTTGKRCFAGQTDFERMLSVVRGEYVGPSVHCPDFPRGLELVIATALAPNPDQRYSSCAALVEALDRLARAEGWASGPQAIAALMRDLFGAVPAPAELAPAEPTTEGVPPTVVITKRRLARGTDAEHCVPETEDEPTRGRRSVPRMLARRFCAAEWAEDAA